MKLEHIKSTAWRIASAMIIASLVLFSTVSSSGLASAANKGDKGKHEVALAPVEPPQIKTHPLHVPKGGPKDKTPGSTPEALSGLDAAATADTSAALEEAAAPPSAAQPIHTRDPRDMKVLIISPITEQYFPNEPNGGYDTRYRLQAIKAFLEQIGIPYEVYVANSGGAHNPLPALWDGVNRGYYQGIVLETGNQWIYAGGGNYIPFLLDAEWTALWDYEVMFGVRELVMFVGPNQFNAESYGLTYSGEGYLSSTTSATLTDAGRAIYPYINAANSVPFINTYYYRSTLETGDPHPAVPLVMLDGYPVVSTHTAADGHETLAITADYTNYLISSLALSYGSINWLTKGVFLGERHAYLAPQVDDLLIDDNVWDPVARNDWNDDLTYRMSGSDLLAIQTWQSAILGTSGNTCVTLQPAANGKDTYIDNSNQGTNYGNNGSLFTGAPNSKTADLRTLIQFDLSSILQGTTISSANFSIYLSSSPGGADTVNIYPVTRTWVEGSGMSRRAPTGATWSTYDGISMHGWTTSGGDYNSTSAGSFVAGTTGWKLTSLSTALVQSWIDSPSSNYGMILRSPTSTSRNNSKKAYYSSDNASYSLVPKLQVCFPAATSTFKLEFGFNGEGASGLYTPDTLTPAVIQNQANFRWINHTYSHLSMDTATAQQTTDELTRNDKVAINQLGLTNYSRAPFIQPDISGLYNPNFQSAAYAFGVRYLISDTSRPEWNNPSPNTGIYSTLQPGLLIVPRHPTNLFYNLVTPEQWVSEYNCYYGPVAYPQCANGQWNYWPRDLTYAEILDKESDMMLQYLLKWDIDPLMFHQANLGVYDGTNSLFSQLVDATLAKYRALINLPIRNPGQSEIGTRMAERMAYNASGIRGTLTPCSGISMTVTNAAKIPVTGVAYGNTQESYGGQTISYVTVSAGGTVNLPVTCP